MWKVNRLKKKFVQEKHLSEPIFFLHRVKIVAGKRPEAKRMKMEAA